jgi:cell division transport system permease protein
MSQGLFETIATEIRILVRIFQETLGGFRRTGWMNLVIIITMSSILSIFGVLFAFVLESGSLVDNLGSGLKLSVYLKEDASLNETVNQIKRLGKVKQMELIPKEQAWRDMRKVFEGEIPELENPLPDTIHVQMQDPNDLEPMVKRIKTLKGVESVNYAKAVLLKLQQIAKYTSWVSLVALVFLGTLTMFIISNTIHLLIEARGREIEILRMMGVTNSYIRLPFLMQGAIYGLIGALVAYIPLLLAENGLNQLFQFFQFSTSGNLTFVFVLMMLIGVTVGAGGAFTSMRKYLKV